MDKPVDELAKMLWPIRSKLFIWRCRVNGWNYRVWSQLIFIANWMNWRLNLTNREFLRSIK